MVKASNPAPDNGEQGQFEGTPLSGLNLPKVPDRAPDAIQRGILQRMAKATSWSEVLSVHSGDSGRDKVGESHEFLEVGFDTFVTPEGNIVPIAHVKTINLDTGEEESWRTTATNIVSALAMAAQNNWLPVKGKVGSTRTKNGFDVQYLEPIQ